MPERLEHCHGVPDVDAASTVRVVHDATDRVPRMLRLHAGERQAVSVRSFFGGSPASMERVDDDAPSEHRPWSPTSSSRRRVGEGCDVGGIGQFQRIEEVDEPQPGELGDEASPHWRRQDCIDSAGALG
jgi:hypothetical protein